MPGIAADWRPEGRAGLREGPRSGLGAGIAAQVRPMLGGLFPRCANPACSTGWVRLWRSRKAPVFEGCWTCSPECTAEVVRRAVRREAGDGAGPGEKYSHRIPLGLMLVEQGRLSAEQLRTALVLRRRASEETGEAVRLGDWLVESGVLSEAALMRTVGLQWNCPVLALNRWRPQEVASALPRVLGEVAGALPVRVAGGKMLYVAYGGAVDHALSYALRRILGLEVGEGIARDSEMRVAQARYLETPGPRARYLEVAGSQPLIRTIAGLMERERPVDARLARFRNYYWLRLWKHAAGGENLPLCSVVEDVICATPGHSGQ